LLPIKFKAKPYVKTFLQNNLPALKADRTTAYGKYLLSLLEKGADHKRSYELEGIRYPEVVTVYISNDSLERFGSKLKLEAEGKMAVAFLNSSQTMDFNEFVGKTVRAQVRAQVAAYLHFDPNLKRAIHFSRAFFNLSAEDYEEDSIRRDISRARVANDKLPRIYKKPSEQLSDSK
jgi:hypothetical protein